MLNISENKIDDITVKNMSALKRFKPTLMKRRLVNFFKLLTVIFLIVMFLPWTQTIDGRGQLSTLQPAQRPQEIHTTIAGRIEKWYVREGQKAAKGDTIVFLSEIKTDYFDPELIKRTQEQIVAKENSYAAYTQKVEVLQNQGNALNANLTLKTNQARNKIKQSKLKLVSDSMDWIANKTNFEIAKVQFERQEKLYQQGLKSLTDLESRRLKFQEANAKLIATENKYLVSQNELINANIELNSIKNDFIDKVSKSQSDMQSAQSDAYDAQATIAKLRNQLANYKMRNSFYYITAPQDCYIVKALTKGIGETVKEGEAIVSIAPQTTNYAVETYVEPFNLPLIQIGEKVRIEFDGWPTLIFSGWPGVTFGTFGGKIAAVDYNISNNGKYRILVAETSEEPWPKQLRLGQGCNTLAMLNDVPVWWEIWRQLNSFPPDFYTPEKEKKESNKEKKEKK
jgi:multidrug resistance efflux pump